MNSAGLNPAQVGPSTGETRARVRPRRWFCAETPHDLKNS
jgi:hypothetical protein